MTKLSMHAVSAPVFARALRNLSDILAKAEQQAKDKGYDAAVLLSARLAPDMLPLTRQIHIATDNAKGAACRLSGRDVPSWADDEKTFAEIQARIAKTRDLLKSVAEADFAGADKRSITLKLRSGEMTFDAISYVTRFAVPNFYFHVTTAYNILRHNGVPLGKPDFLGNR
jgi:hypothetical protein